MSKSKKIASPQERPDLYDYPDVTPGNSKVSQAYLDAVMPEHVKQAVAARKRKSAA